MTYISIKLLWKKIICYQSPWLLLFLLFCETPFLFLCFEPLFIFGSMCGAKPIRQAQVLHPLSEGHQPHSPQGHQRLGNYLLVVTLVPLMSSTVSRALQPLNKYWWSKGRPNYVPDYTKRPRPWLDTCPLIGETVFTSSTGHSIVKIKWGSGQRRKGWRLPVCTQASSK